MEFNAAIKSVARHLRYSPETMAEMYFDDTDFYGLVYWWKDAMDSVKKVKEVSKVKKWE